MCTHWGYHYQITESDLLHIRAADDEDDEDEDEEEEEKDRKDEDEEEEEEEPIWTAPKLGWESSG
jgi:hypothetical protein